MPAAREEVVLLALVLLALGLLALGLSEVMWPRARRAPRSPGARASGPKASPSIPSAAPRMTVPSAPPSNPMNVEELLDQAVYLVDFPLRALVLLRRADEQLTRLPGASARVEALQERLHAAHVAVGCRLLEAGLAEQAVAPLIRVVSENALRGDDRRRAREALVGALTEIADQRGQAIRRLAQDGNTTAALAHGDRLVTLLQGALESGLTETELAAALSTAQRVFAHLGVRRVVTAR